MHVCGVGADRFRRRFRCEIPRKNLEVSVHAQGANLSVIVDQLFSELHQRFR